MIEVAVQSGLVFKQNLKIPFITLIGDGGVMVKRVSKLKRIDGITHGSHIDTVYPDPLGGL